MNRLKEIKERALKASDGWTGSMNYPFDATLKRPRSSMSKHDTDKYDKIPFLHVDDAALICSAKNDILYLLERIEKLQLFKHDIEWHFTTSFFYDNKARDESLKKIIDEYNKEKK